ncbi:MAG: discoidin domain-containing protein [Actinomycetota bacterium]
MMPVRQPQGLLTRSLLIAAILGALFLPVGTAGATGDADGDGIPDSLDLVVNTGSNVSATKQAVQSSIQLNDVANFGPNNATDRVSTFAPVARTADASPWWQVDLGALHTIDGINLHAQPMDGAVVMVTARPLGFVSLDEAEAVAVWSTTITSTDSLTQVAIPDRVGRYVRIQLPAGTGMQLELAEVDVIGEQGTLNDADGDFVIDAEDVVSTTGSIVSTDKPAAQSSLFAGRPFVDASAAVDGLRDGGRDQQQPMAITDDDEPWWEVDLGASYSIDGINLFTQADGTLDALNGAIVMAGDTTFGDATLADAQAAATWTADVGDLASHVVQLAVPDVDARFVRVQLPADRSDRLGLAEVDVIGRPSAESTLSNVALGAAAFSTYDHYADQPGARAVDGNKVATSSRWVSAIASPTITPTLTLDFGARYEISEMRHWNGWTGYNIAVDGYTVEYRTDPTDPWRPLFSRTGNTDSIVVDTFVPVLASQVRITIDEGRARFYEVEFLGAGLMMEPGWSNVALGAGATSTFDHYGNQPGSRAVDGDKVSTASRWVSAIASPTVQPSLTLDLGETYEIAEIRIWNGHLQWNNPVDGYRIEYWDASLAQWVNALERTGNTASVTRDELTPVSTSQVRITVTSGRARFFEVEVLGR